MEEDICLRKNTGGRERRSQVSRTPTAVVSEVFRFLSEDPAAAADHDDDDEFTMSDEEVDRLFSNLDIDMKSCADGVSAEDFVNSNLLYSNCDREKFLAEFKSKDSGFASLERQRCEPSSLYDSFLENEDDTEDAIESISSNDINASISESFYDDVELSVVPRSLSMEAKSTCVDDETENAIASSAEQFSTGLENSFPESDSASLVDSESQVADVLEKNHVTSKKGDSYNSHYGEEAINCFNSTKGVTCSVSYNFDATFNFEDTAHTAGKETTGAAVSSVSSDDGDDGNEDDGNEDDAATDSEYAACVNYQAYDSIDAISPDLKQDADPLLGNSLIYRGDFVPSLSPMIEDADPLLGNRGDFVPSLTPMNEDADVQIAEPANNSLSEKSPVSITRKHKLEKNPSAEVASDDSSDEDVGIYAESFRRSNWVRVSQEGRLEVKVPNTTSLSQAARSSTALPLVLTPGSGGCAMADCTDTDAPFSAALDEVFADLHSPPSHAKVMHKRSDSVATTASETEFKCQYVSRRKCLIQRADSQQEYHRLSSRVYDQDKQVTVHRTSESEDLGLHLLDSHPAYITSVDPGSPAERAGITEGQILVSVNDQTVLTTDHADIVELIHSLTGDIKLGVANSDFQPVRDLQATVMSGYMYKLGNSAFRIWKKRYFLLRQDNCLYYYKNEQETDPLGAVPLGGYTISRHTETSKDFCFKAEKYGGRTYYFVADNRDQMTEWVSALTEAAARSKRRKESFLSVSSHNVGLPALHIMKPDCAGFLGKLSPSKRTWRRRYCILKDACVYYYKDKSSVSALGVAHLHGYTVDVENFQRRKFSFSLQPPEKKMRVFCFSSDNDTDKKRWVESLIHSIQRWVRIDKEVEC
ncbi:unnamed protein product [Candidula unifasciata]|uniref:Uncharacterized protein n=1 Tax=Candidula unifasciata TaxID=100452 RepID=A0A8S3ZPC9_9EUPU|nr:unnamed protein product [Candidula unifasciata]